MRKSVPVWRIAITLGGLATLALLAGEGYADGLLPWYGWVFQQFDTGLVTQSIGLEQRGAETYLVWKGLTGTEMLIAGHALPPRVPLSSATLMAHAALHPVLVFSVALCYPATSMAERLRYLAGGAILLLPLEAMDVPVLLWAAIDDLLRFQLSAETRTTLSLWMHFLNNGGRLGLSLFMGFAAVGLAQQLGRINLPGSRSPAGH